MKKCPPGVFCFENFTMFFIVLIILGFVYMFYKSSIQIKNNVQIKQPSQPSSSFGFLPNFPYFGVGENVLLNPMAPPLRDERYITGVVPINVPTNIGAVETNYRQLGLLTPVNQSSKDNILPLMGRPLFTNRDKWNYYTISNQHNNVKLPVSKAGKSCTNEYGCDKLYDGDTVYVEGANEAYKATIYENDVIRYLPFV